MRLQLHQLVAAPPHGRRPSMLAARIAKQLSTRLVAHCKHRQSCTLLLGARWIAPAPTACVHRLPAGRPDCRRWWVKTRFLCSTVEAEESNLLSAIRSFGAQGGVVELEDVVSQARGRRPESSYNTPCGAGIRTNSTACADVCYE